MAEAIELADEVMVAVVDAVGLAAEVSDGSELAVAAGEKVARFVALGESDHHAERDGVTLSTPKHLAADCPEEVPAVHGVQTDGLLPIGQNACLLQHQVAYHGYEGLALNHEERERLVADLGDKPLMLLRNHGTLAVGQTAAQAWIGMFFLERACKMQIMALTAGRDGVLECGEELQDKVAGQGGLTKHSSGMSTLTDRLVWPALLRKLDRQLPGYAA